MDKLLKAVLDAHGGLENWSKVKKLTARMSLGGPFWAARGWPELYSNSSVTIDPHREYITFSPFSAPDRMSALTVNPERIAITTLDGQVIEERLNPRDSFPRPFGNDTRWDAIQGRILHERSCLELPRGTIWLYAARRRRSGNRSLDRRNGNVAAAGRDVPGNHRQPQLQAGVLLRRRTHAAAHGLFTRRYRKSSSRSLFLRPQNV